MTSTLTELRDRVQAATEESRELFAEAFDTIAPGWAWDIDAQGVMVMSRLATLVAIGAYLDAVVALCELKLPGWRWSVDNGDTGRAPCGAVWPPSADGSTTPAQLGETPVLALLAALLTALPETTDAGVR